MSVVELSINYNQQTFNMLRLLRSPAPIRRFYSTAVVKDLNELDEVLFKYSALPKDDRIAALRILNKENVRDHSN
jgi:hypothetical protein